MPRSEPGPATSFPITFTVPLVAGNCGRRPAIKRRMVDLPHPDGPRIDTNSPRAGRLRTVNEILSIAVACASYIFVTPSNSTIGSSTDGFNQHPPDRETGRAAPNP